MPGRVGTRSGARHDLRVPCPAHQAPARRLFFTKSFSFPRLCEGRSTLQEPPSLRKSLLLAPGTERVDLGPPLRQRQLVDPVGQVAQTGQRFRSGPVGRPAGILAQCHIPPIMGPNVIRVGAPGGGGGDREDGWAVWMSAPARALLVLVAAPSPSVCSAQASRPYPACLSDARAGDRRTPPGSCRQAAPDSRRPNPTGTARHHPGDIAR